MLMVTISPSSAVYGDPPEEPVLQIFKFVDKNEVELGKNITVHVNITNWSEYSLYNLTIDEPLFSDWTYTDFQGFDDYVWVEVKSGGSISYSYTMKIISEGNYTIRPTTIEYVDSNGTEYNSRSGSLPVNVFIGDPIVDNSELWQNILTWSLLILILPIVLLVVNRVLFRKN